MKKKSDFIADGKHLAAILDSTTEGIFGIDRKARCTFVNRTFLHLLGYKRNDCLGKNLHQLTHYKRLDGRKYPISQCPIYKAFQQGKAAPLTEEILWHKNGTPLPVLYSSSIIRERGKIAGAVVTVIDNRRLKQAEEQVKLTEERFRLALNNSNITVFNQDQRLRYSWIYNPHAPLTVKDFLGKTDLQIFEKETASILTKLKKKVLATGERIHTVVDLQFDTTLETYDMRLEPLKDVAGKVIGITGAAAEITERSQLEKRKNEFISIASHELKTPITTIKAFSQILKKRLTTSKEPQLVYFTDNIIKQVDKLTNLINDLLDVSKIEEGKLALVVKKCDIDELVKKIVVDFQYITDSHTIELVSDVHKKIIIDEERIGQVLINLISNAIKYSPHSSKVIVRTKATKNAIVISVQDFGVGIPKEEQKAIFERFYRTSEKQTKNISGFGLGLYISHVIVTRHSGNIWVKSSPNKGSTFYFSLPIHITR